MTFGADGTMHRNVGYAAQHVHLKTESYSEDANPQRSTHLLGVQSTLDGSSEQSVIEWKECLENIAEIYNKSPLAKRKGHLLRVIDIFVKLSGMHSDHCAKEKKDARLMEKEKRQATYQSLGEDAILEKSNQELLPDFTRATEEMIKCAGGTAKWEKLSELEQAEHQAKMMEKLVIELGADAYQRLSNPEKCMLSLFIWAGCGCHKDLNSVRGGNASMMAWWDANGEKGPVLLANRDNAAVIKDKAPDSDTVTPAQQQAFEMTTRGGIKATKLAGDILNNTNDKKGHHDTFRSWWKTNVGEDLTFPDTSNTCFQSHCEAAAVLLQHLPHFVEFLDFIKDKKADNRFSNMEQNLYNALKCTATQTELAVLALYGQVISHPYFRKTCGAANKDVNMLDLGPFHKKVLAHMKRIIEDPSFILGDSASFEMGALDGLEWESPKAVAAIQKLAKQLPHISAVLVAFFEGAAETWKRFTSEFAPGGLIDEATTEEKDQAWMPPTNDVNEGALGSFRLLMRRQPQLSSLHYNAHAMFHFNKTQAFMDKILEPEDHKFLHMMGRDPALLKQQRERLQKGIEHQEAKNAKKSAAREKRMQNAARKAERLAAVKVIKNRDDVKLLKGEKLKDCLQAYIKWGAPIPKDIKIRSPVAAIREALQVAIDSYNSGDWKPGTPSEEEPDSEDEDLTAEIDSVDEDFTAEIDLVDDETEWEDEEE